MRSLRTVILTTTALVTLAGAMQATAQPAAPASAQSAKYLHLSDEALLQTLVDEYRNDPTSYERSIEYISLNRPALHDSFLLKTSILEHLLATTQPERYKALGAKAGPGAAAAALPNPATSATTMAIIGAIAAGTAYAVIEKKKDEEDRRDGPNHPNPPVNPDPPEGNQPPVEGDPNSFRTAEYYSSYGLEAIGAASKYSQGAQGHGVKLSVLDTGIDTSNVEFSGKIDLDNSYSYFNNGGSIEDTGGHGSHVAGTIAAHKNDNGTHGVAFGSSLVIFKGIPGDASDGSSTVPNVWADAMNRSVDAGAFAMNNSWNYVQSDGAGGTEAIPITNFSGRADLTSWLGTNTINALNNAVANDLLVVSATGNDGASEVAVNAGVPVHLHEYAGYMIAVTSTDENNEISPFANRCGIAQDHCLAAPGSWINSTGNGGGVVTMSGTSMATPHVTGAAAVIKSQNPELTAPEVTQILFDTATDLGDAGVDAVYGHGLLNLGEAQSPQGNLVIYAGDDTTGGKYLLKEVGILASSAMAGAFTSALSDQNLMVGDKYDRAYSVSAQGLVSVSSASIPSASLSEKTKVDDNVTLTRSDTGLSMSFEDESVSYTLTQGNLESAGTLGAMTPLAFQQADFGADYSFALADGLSFNAGVSGGDGTHTATRLGLQADLGQATIAANLGKMDERGSVLGSRFMGGAGENGAADTHYLEISGSLGLAPRTTLTLSGTRSETNFTQSGLVTGGRNLEGSAARISLARQNFMGSAGTLTASISSPLQVTSGEITMDLPQGRTASIGGVKSTAVERKSTTVSFDQDTRPLDIGFSYAKEMDNSGLGISMNAGYRSQGSLSTPFLGMKVSKKF